MSVVTCHRTGHVITGIVLCVLLLAGLFKFLDLSEFAAAVAAWTIVPTRVRPAVVVFVPALEMVIAGLWILGVGRGRAVAAAMCFLVVATVMYSIQIAVGERPACGCLGVFGQYEWTRMTSEFVLARNAVLVASLLGGAMLCRVQSQFSHEAHAPVPRGRSAGFTLIEMILVVALVATLVATLLPSLAGLRTNIRCSRSLVTMRSHGAVFAAYCNDYRGNWPYVTDPQSHYTILRSGDIDVPVLYFQAVNRWNVGLADSYYGGRAVHEVFSFPGRPPTPFTIYNYSQAMLADPAYWNESTRTGPVQWRATSDHEVTFPSTKALLVDSHSERVRRANPSKVGGSPIGMVFCDNSSRAIPIQDILPGYRQFTGWTWHGIYNSVLSRGMHTIDGVRGRDVR